MLGSYPPLTASGNINPSRFVKISGSNTVAAAGANERVFGVSQIGTKVAPGTAGDSGYAAVSGDSLTVHQPGEYVKVEYGGTITAGALLKSGTAGVAVAALTTGAVMQWVCAEAVESGVSGDIRYVKLMPPTPYYPALS